MWKILQQCFNRLGRGIAVALIGLMVGFLSVEAIRSQNNYSGGPNPWLWTSVAAGCGFVIGVCMRSNRVDGTPARLIIGALVGVVFGGLVGRLAAEGCYGRLEVEMRAIRAAGGLDENSQIAIINPWDFKHGVRLSFESFAFLRGLAAGGAIGAITGAVWMRKWPVVIGGMVVSLLIGGWVVIQVHEHITRVSQESREQELKWPMRLKELKTRPQLRNDPTVSHSV